MRPLRLIAVPLLLILVACPPARGGGDDDDAAESPADGALAYRPMNDYGGGFYYAMFAFRPDGEITCSEWIGSDFDADDLGGDWVSVYLYRGSEMPWEQTYYGTYDEENSCGFYDDEDPYEDYADLHCAYVHTSEGSYLDDPVVTISDWSSSRVRGNVSTALIDEDFDLSNCGEYDPYGDDDDSMSDDDDSAWARKAAPGARGSRWRLRVR